MALEAPRITIYYRIISNIDGNPITKYMLFDTTNPPTLNFGQINFIKGGESPYIIEFDIWNNEPAFSAGLLPDRVSDAKNCVFEVWNDNKLSAMDKISSDVNNRESSYVLARCVTKLKDNSWIRVAGGYSLDEHYIFGNVNPNKFGVLSGQPGGDHTIIQTKLDIPPETQSSINFVFNFEYEYDE